MAGSWADKTVEGGPKSANPDEGYPEEPHLFVLMECHRPLAGASRAALAGIDEITFGRGTARGFTREGATLAVRIPDPLMSSSHGRITRARGESTWTYEDVGSMNGSRIDGQRVTRAPLLDAAVLELGTTLFSLRTALPTPPGTRAAVDSSALPQRAIGLATLLPAYAAELAVFPRVAGSEVPVLLLGESGTGKEVLARAVHVLSGRSGSFVPVNCGALPETLVEGQLFGHVKGSFSGAVRDEPGFVRSSDKGTLFLDEIGDLPKTSQAALLRVLQEREVTPLGTTRPHKVDLRVVAATHRKVDAALDARADLTESGAFRADLYARLAGFTHTLAPLRARKEDLGLLVAELLPQVTANRSQHGAPASPPAKIGLDLARALFRYDWPLNVRELHQALTVATVLAGDTLQLAHAPESLRRAAATPRDRTGSSSPPAPARPASERPRPSPSPLPPEAEQLRISLVSTLETHRGNVSEVARAMKTTRMQVHRWMRRFGVDAASYRR